MLHHEHATDRCHRSLSALWGIARQGFAVSMLSGHWSGRGILPGGWRQLAACPSDSPGRLDGSARHHCMNDSSLTQELSERRMLQGFYKFQGHCQCAIACVLTVPEGWGCAGGCMFDAVMHTAR